MRSPVVALTFLRCTLRRNAEGMMMLVKRENGKGMGLTLFENEDDLKRGDEALNKMNLGGGGQRTSVEFYEVAIQRM